MFKDPLIRRFLSASMFAAAFVWVAVTYFNVETEVVWAFLVFSVGFVILMVLVGLLFAPVISMFNRRPPMLSRLRKEADQKAEVSDTKQDEDRSL